MKCPDCGGDCSPECGLHPLGCIFGGMFCGYWMTVDGCQLEHRVKHYHTKETPCPEDTGNIQVGMLVWTRQMEAGEFN